MGGIGDFLFGDTEEAKQTGTAATLTPEQADLLKQLTGFVSGGIGEGAERFPGQITAGPSPLQQQGFDLTGQFLGGGLPGDTTLDTLLADFDPALATQAFEKGIADPARQRFQEDILPGIAETFTSQNALSSGASLRAATRAGTDLETGLSGILANLLFQGEQGTLDRQLQALPVELQRILAPILTGVDVGGVQRGIEQQGLTGELGEFLRTQPGANPLLNLLGPSLGTRAFEPIVQGPTSQEGFLSTIAPAATAAIIASSKRFKNNIQTLGHINGVRVVSFRYNGSLQTHTGVIAEELAEIHPGCVFFGHDSKPLGVYYGKLRNTLGA